MNAGLYTVTEYAELKGISQQAVYKAVKQRRLKTVEKVENNRRKKFIILDAEQPEEQPTEQQNASKNGGSSKPVEQPEREVEQPEVEKVEYSREYDILLNELETVRAEREQLKKRNEELERSIQDYASRFAAIAAQALETAERSQYLQAAATQPKVKSITDTQAEIAAEVERTNKRSAWKQFIAWVRG